MKIKDVTYLLQWTSSMQQTFIVAIPMKIFLYKLFLNEIFIAQVLLNYYGIFLVIVYFASTTSQQHTQTHTHTLHAQNSNVILTK